MANNDNNAVNENENQQERKAEKSMRPVSVPRMWARRHKYVFYIAAGILLIVLIFIGIRIYNNASHPITKLAGAAAKDFNSSFTFQVEAQNDGKTVMEYTGAYEADSAKQNLKAVYDADYGSYKYKGAVYAQDGTYLSGSLYKKEWRVRDCTEKVLNFFDFNTDFRSGNFDGPSFLRFTDLTSQFSANELNDFVKLLKNRMDGHSSLAKVTVTSKDGSKTYSYDINTGEFFDLVREKGASMFFNAIHYDAFCKLYERNEKTVKASKCALTYTINSDGWLTDLSISVTAGGKSYAVNCKMDDFGAAEVNIPKAFLKAEVLE